MSLPIKIFCFCTKKCGSGSALVDDLCLWKVCSLRSSDFFDCTRTSHNGQRSELSSMSSLFPWNEKWSRRLQTHSCTHIHIVSCMMKFNDEWGWDGLSLHSQFVHGANNGFGSFLGFTVSCFSTPHPSLLIFSSMFILSNSSPSPCFHTVFAYFCVKERELYWNKWKCREGNHWSE